MTTTPSPANSNGGPTAAPDCPETTGESFHDVAVTLIAMGVIGTIMLAVGTFYVAPLQRAAPLAWPGVAQAMEGDSKLLVLGCCIFLTLPFVRNAALTKCLQAVDAKVRRRAFAIMGLSTALIAATMVLALR